MLKNKIDNQQLDMEKKADVEMAIIFRMQITCEDKYAESGNT